MFFSTALEIPVPCLSCVFESKVMTVFQGPNPPCCFILVARKVEFPSVVTVSALIPIAAYYPLTDKVLRTASPQPPPIQIIPPQACHYTIIPLKGISPHIHTTRMKTRPKPFIPKGVRRDLPPKRHQASLEMLQCPGFRLFTRIATPS